MISRVRNIVFALSYYKMFIYDTSIQYALEESNKYTVSIQNYLWNKNSKVISLEKKKKLNTLLIYKYNLNV